MVRTEFEFLKQLREKFNLKKIGDDCAVLPKNKTHDLLITSDLLVEDIDFRRSWMVPEFLGHKALAVSVSDIAAMGGKPLHSMLSLGVPEALWQTDFVDEFYEGYISLANKCGVELIGGDISKTPDKIVIDSTLTGEVRRNKAVMRTGAQAGDLIFVTGELGGAGTGLKILENGTNFFNCQKWQAHLIIKQLRPLPRLNSEIFFDSFPQHIQAGLSASFLTEKEIKLITSMIDISDGLSSDLMHICQASQVGAKIFADKIPLHGQLKMMTKNFSEQLELALNGGEDYELLFTVKPKKNLQKNFASFFCIGEVTANVGIIELMSGDKITVLEPKGYRHF